MTTEIQVIDDTNVNDVLTQIQDAFFDIPFENSAFQTEAFVIAAQVTPERAYRTIGLRMQSKIQAVLEAKHARAKEDIDIEELRTKIEDENTSSFDKRRHELDIAFKLANRKWTDKLMNDAITELNLLYSKFKQFPSYTRDDFEAGERAHFEIKLDRQIKGLQGPHEAMLNMHTDVPSMVQQMEELKLLK